MVTLHLLDYLLQILKYVKMIITPIVAVFGTWGINRQLSDSVVLKKYIIGKGEWNFVISKKWLNIFKSQLTPHSWGFLFYTM